MNTRPETANGPALMAAAAAETARVVAGAAKTASLDQPTPCPDWDLRTLLNHTILWTAYSAERRAHGESVAEELMSKDFTAEPGYAEAYQAQLDRAVHAWSKPEAWAGDRTVMGSATPAADIAAMLIMEMVLHGWDVAKATGQDYHCDGELAQALLGTVRAQGDMFRQYEGFAAVVPVPDDATAFDRALALSGRDPAWKP
ncbi:MAG TPA: TIGR03086 family metal-binding protein [Streptosporangiaceae bacterium]|nr:TIGR03086 family metal-binding protein [Streptosporangiaceae bacterium]